MANMYYALYYGNSKFKTCKGCRTHSCPFPHPDLLPSDSLLPALGLLLFLLFLILTSGPLYLVFPVLWIPFQFVLWLTLLILQFLWKECHFLKEDFPLLDEVSCSSCPSDMILSSPGQGMITTVSLLHNPNAQQELDKDFIHSFNKCLLTVCQTLWQVFKILQWPKQTRFSALKKLIYFSNQWMSRLNRNSEFG